MLQIPSIPHFKGLDMRNLQYEIRICQKSHNSHRDSFESTTIFYETDVKIVIIPLF